MERGDSVKQNLSPSADRNMTALGFSLVGICIFLGVIISFRTAGGIFAEAAALISRLSFEDAAFAESFKRAAGGDFAFCIAVLVLAAAFPVSVLPGGFLLFKGFCLGATAGLAAKTCVTKEAVGIFFAIFISNFLVLPLKVLLFLSSVNFSLRTCTLCPGDKLREYIGFTLKVLIFFVLMCLSECIQLGIGVGVLS